MRGKRSSVWLRSAECVLPMLASATLVGCGETAREKAPPPSVLLISIDTLAASHLPSYGYDRDTAPQLAAFAEESLLFEHCIASAPWTLPSHMAMLTGLYAEAHRITPPAGDGVPPMWQRWRLAEQRLTLAEAFHAAGYATAAFVDNAWLTERFGFAQGFDIYDASAAEIDHGDHEGGIRHVRRLAVDWLDSLSGRPFFLFLHAFDVHGPYGAPAPFHGRFDSPEDGRTAPIGGPSDTYDTIHEYLLAPEVVAAHPYPEELPTAPLRDAYDEGVALVDAELGALFANLAERGALENTIVVLTSDHGETMDAGHYLFGHGVLEESVLHVPLMIRLPSGHAVSRHIDTTVQTVDLYPTLAEWCGLEVGQVHGRSLASVTTERELSARAVLSEGGLMRQGCVVLGGWKLVEKTPGVDSSVQNILSTPGLRELWNDRIVPWCESSGNEGAVRALFELQRQRVDVDALLGRVEREGLHRELWNEYRDRPDVQGVVLLARAYLQTPSYELYDLSSDPEATHDLAGERPEVVERMKRHLDEESALARSARIDAEGAMPAVLSAEQVEELRKLGYAED